MGALCYVFSIVYTFVPVTALNKGLCSWMCLCHALTYFIRLWAQTQAVSLKTGGQPEHVCLTSNALLFAVVEVYDFGYHGWIS